MERKQIRGRCVAHSPGQGARLLIRVCRSTTSPTMRCCSAVRSLAAMGAERARAQPDPGRQSANALRFPEKSDESTGRAAGTTGPGDEPHILVIGLNGSDAVVNGPLAIPHGGSETGAISRGTISTSPTLRAQGDLPQDLSLDYKFLAARWRCLRHNRTPRRRTA